MTAEKVDTPESKKQAWLRELSEFIVKGNLETWAAGKGEVEPTRPGRKRHVYERGDWKLDDEFRAYFAAPGETTVSYKGVEVWVMSYGGAGMREGYEKLAPPTFLFLHRALTKVTPDLPFRGPEYYSEEEGDWEYFFEHKGDITVGSWTEHIRKVNKPLFEQEGINGIVVHRDENYNPIYPWDL